MPSKKPKKKPPQNLYLAQRVVPLIVRAKDEKEALKLAKEADVCTIEDTAGEKLIAYSVVKKVTALKDLPKNFHDAQPEGNEKRSPEQDDDGNDIPDTEAEWGDPMTCKEILTPPKAPKSAKKKPAKKGKK